MLVVMKKQIVICAIVAIVVVDSVSLLLPPKALGNINASFDEPETSASEFSVAEENEERVKFFFRPISCPISVKVRL